MSQRDAGEEQGIPVTPAATSAAGGPGEAGQPQGAARWLVLFSITTGTFMANVDSTAVTVALPTMAREFDVGLDALQWVLLAYLLAITAILPVFGRLADMVGRKRILNTGLALFVGASLVVALAPTFPVLIASRAVQGIGARCSWPRSWPRPSRSSPPVSAAGSWGCSAASSPPERCSGRRSAAC